MKSVVAGESAAMLSELRQNADSVLRYLVDDAVVGVWAVDRSLRVSFASETATEQLLGRADGVLAGRALRGVLPAVFCDRVEENVSWTLQSGDPVVSRGVWRGRCLRSTFLSGRSAGGDQVVVVTRPETVALGAERETPGVVDAEFAELGPLDALTPRELEVLAYFGQGLGIQDTAKQLHRAVTTVKRFREGIARKLNIPDRCRLGQIARDRGLRPDHAGLPRVKMDGEFSQHGVGLN